MGETAADNDHSKFKINKAIMICPHCRKDIPTADVARHFASKGGKGEQADDHVRATGRNAGGKENENQPE